MVSKDKELHQTTADTNLDFELPEGWAFPKISDLLAVNYGKGLRKSNREPGIVPVYGSNGVVGRHKSALTEGPTIIIGRKGTVGAVNFSTVPCWPIDTTYFIDRFNGLIPQFISHALRSLNLSDLDTSTAIPGLNRNDIYRQHIPLPPIPEQKRIMTQVDELLARVNAARERLAKVKEILKRFRQSVLSAACSGRLTAGWRDENLNVEPAKVLFNSIEQKREREYVEECRRAKAEKRRKPIKWTNLSQKLHTENVKEFASIPSTWIYIPLGKIAGRGTDSIVDGPFGTSINVKTDYINCGVPVVRINNIRALKFLPNNLRFVSELKYQQLIRHCILPGDVLLTKVGTIGESCVFPDSYIKAMLSTTGSCRIRVDAELAEYKYICIYLNSLKQYLNSMVSESVQPFLNMRVIKNLPTALPPLEEQREIVRRVEALFNLADRIEMRVAAAGEKAERLTQAILAKAFRGELVTTEAELARREGCSYEAALALLDKINEEWKETKIRKKRQDPKNMTN